MKIVKTDIENWEDIFKLNRWFLSPYVFRGQSDQQWRLTTSIERSIISRSKFDTGLQFGYETEERWMLHEFKKKYPLYSSILPKQADNLEWLAIMQHYGAPTRLLDFTESIFIAAYFSMIDSVTDSSIWCIHQRRLRKLAQKKFNLNYEEGKSLKDEINDIHIDVANKFIAKKDGAIEENMPSSVIPIEPNLITERLSKQQGLFLMPTNSKIDFFENLKEAVGIGEDSFHSLDIKELIEYSNQMKHKDVVDVLKINLSKNLYLDGLSSLKQMNITAENLFPGVDGLAKSLIHSHILT